MIACLLEPGFIVIVLKTYNRSPGAHGLLPSGAQNKIYAPSVFLVRDPVKIGGNRKTKNTVPRNRPSCPGRLSPSWRDFPCASVM